MKNTPPNQEQPVYILPENKARSLTPKFLTFFLLGIIFYLGVWLNLDLMELSESTEELIQIISLALLSFLILLSISLAVRRANQPYKFYRNRLWIHNKELTYLNIFPSSIFTRQNFWDKVFKTYSVNLGNQFYLRHISNSTQITGYLQQLVDYSKKGGIRFAF